MSRGTLDTANCDSDFGYEVFTLYDRTSQTVLLSCRSYIAVRTPSCTHNGLGSFPFARRYLGNRCFFLLLRVLRCFSSPGFPLYDYFIHHRIPMHYHRCVPAFGNLRIIGYLLLPAAYRSLSRPSSAPSAKASALCSFSLDLLLVFSLFCFVALSRCGTHIL